MTRVEALALLRPLCHGLAADSAGVSRLLERISVQAEAEALRDALTERGAAALLGEVDEGPTLAELGVDIDLSDPFWRKR